MTLFALDHVVDHIIEKIVLDGIVTLYSYPSKLSLAAMPFALSIMSLARIYWRMRIRMEFKRS